MPLAIKRVVGAWYGEGNKSHAVKAREQEHVKLNIEFVKEDPDMVKAKGRQIFVGKSLGCHIILDNKKISDVHCEITDKRIDQWYIKDLASDIGTYIQREKALIKLISGEFKIQTGDRIIIGDPSNKDEPATFLEIVQA